jgi:Lrp/AsnC family leucine-responsive transcriptional regulator
MPSLDPTDLRLMGLLQVDSKQTIKELAAKLNLSTTPVYERIKRLEREGYINRYVAILDREKMHMSLMAFCNISLKEHSKKFIDQFEREILELPEVNSCYHLTGMYDYLLKVIVKDVSAYQHFIVEKLATLENIGKVESALVMNEIKESTAIQLL